MFGPSVVSRLHYSGLEVFFFSLVGTVRGFPGVLHLSSLSCLVDWIKGSGLPVSLLLGVSVSFASARLFPCSTLGWVSRSFRLSAGWGIKCYSFAVYRLAVASSGHIMSLFVFTLLFSNFLPETLACSRVSGGSSQHSLWSTARGSSAHMLEC